MARLGLLERIDRRNQAVADYLGSRPEAGTKAFPYAKTERARRLLGFVAVGVGVVTMLAWTRFGWVAGVVMMVVAVAVGAVVSWRLEHHPWTTGRCEAPGTDTTEHDATHRRAGT